MTHVNHELAGIIESLDAITRVQERFGRYQKAHFADRPPEFFALELAGEAGEVANNEKKRWKGREVEDEKIAEEAADVCIALMNYANSRNIDLAASVAGKLKKIEPIRLARKRKGMEY